MWPGGGSATMSSLTLWLLSMTGGIRRRRNAAEFARIEPIHAATLAGVDDDIARSAIHLVDHGLAARRTLQVSLARRLAARWQGLNPPRFCKAARRRSPQQTSASGSASRSTQGSRAAARRPPDFLSAASSRAGTAGPSPRAVPLTRERRATPARCRSGRTSAVPLPFASTPWNSAVPASRPSSTAPAQERRSLTGPGSGRVRGTSRRRPAAFEPAARVA